MCAGFIWLDTCCVHMLLHVDMGLSKEERLLFNQHHLDVLLQIWMKSHCTFFPHASSMLLMGCCCVVFRDGDGVFVYASLRQCLGSSEIQGVDPI